MHQPKRAEKGDLEQLYQRLKQYRTAMFTTVGKGGHIHSRPMETQEREPDGDLWFVTSKKTLKVDELGENPNVGIIYFRDGDSSYISIAGTARIEDDPALIRSKWKEDWRVWFGEGPESPDICLIKVAVDEAEYWQPEGGTLRVMFEAARAYVTGGHPELNEPERIVAGPKPDREFIDPA
ncbi:MAG: pyridoxamine 5-phosphate oxidase [Cyanobacteria bacterium RYN_339]|nr:pyridoxamine 5-phosphate oxidase [Cyanobacteria bacterium RYN_339]